VVSLTDFTQYRRLAYGGRMGLLDGKRLLITGVLTDASIAYGVAETAIAEGAEIVLTGAGRGKKLTERVARKLGDSIDVLELDVTETSHVEAVRAQLADKWGEVDGALHAIGFAPESCLGDGFMDTPWDDVATAVHISTYSLKTVAEVVAPLMPNGGSIVGLDFDAAVAWPAYNWMGIAKAGMESLNRYLARELGGQGIRVNLVAAGPLRTLAAKSIPGFADFEDAWAGRAPLGWDVADADGVARSCCALLSDWLPQTTGEIIHVDGGYHAIGA
jgi:enoyl ACP reductase